MAAANANALPPLALAVARQFQPVVLVSASPEAEAIARKNGVSVAELLRPFALKFGDSGPSVSFRTSSGVRSVTLRNFGLRLFAPEDCTEVEGKAADLWLDAALEGMVNAKLEDDGVSDAQDAARFLRRNADPTPWFNEYRQRFSELLRFSPFELVDQPVAWLLVLASTDRAPLKRLEELQAPSGLPRTILQAVTGAHVLKLYLVLHDKQNPVGAAATEQQLRDLAEAGVSRNQCLSVGVNSLSEPAPINRSDVPDPWAAPWRPPVEAVVSFFGGYDSKEPRGRFLSGEDHRALTKLLSDAGCNIILPYLERRLHEMHSNIAQVRKGLGNRIRYFWSRKPTDKAAAESGGAGVGPSSSPPSGAGVASGLLYELSSIEGQVRLLADWAFVLQDYRTAMENYQLAVYDYKQDKAARYLAPALEMSALCMSMMGDVSRGEVAQAFEGALEKYLDLGDSRRATRCALWLVDWHRSANAADGLRAAVQTLLRVQDKEPGVRGALLLEQAAYCFLRLGLVRKYAFHLILAGRIFHKAQRRQLALHCHRSAGSVYTGRCWSRIDDYLNEKLGRDAVATGQQDAALFHFSRLVDSCAGSQAPERRDEFLADFREVAQAKLRQKREAFTSLRLPRINMSSIEVSQQRGQQVSQQRRRSAWMAAGVEVEEDRCAFVGEPVIVAFEATNPLHTALFMARARLVAKMRTANDLEHAVTVHGPEIETSLGPAQVGVLELYITPEEPGRLDIEGFEANVLGDVPVFQRFEVPMRKVFRRQEEVQMPDPRLSVPVRAAVRQLDIAFGSPVPSIMFAGQVWRTTLAARDVHSGALLEAGTAAASSLQWQGRGCGVEQVAERTQFLLRAGEQGTLQYELLLRYGPEENWRVCRVAGSVRVLPLLHVDTFCRIAAGDAERKVVGVSVRNEDARLPVAVQVPRASQEWHRLLPREVTTAFFSVQREEEKDISGISVRFRVQYLVSQEHDMIEGEGELVQEASILRAPLGVDGSFPLVVSLDFERVVSAAFSAARFSLAEVPVTFRLYNASSAPANFVFECNAPDEEFNVSSRQFVQLAQVPLRRRFIWSGITQRHFVLNPQSHCTFRVSAVFPEPGVYNLNRFKISLQGRPRPFCFPHVQHLIEVVQDPSFDEDALPDLVVHDFSLNPADAQNLQELVLGDSDDEGVNESDKKANSPASEEESAEEDTASAGGVGRASPVASFAAAAPVALGEVASPAAGVAATASGKAIIAGAAGAAGAAAAAGIAAPAAEAHSPRGVASDDEAVASVRPVEFVSNYGGLPQVPAAPRDDKGAEVEVSSDQAMPGAAPVVPSPAVSKKGVRRRRRKPRQDEADGMVVTDLASIDASAPGSEISGAQQSHGSSVPTADGADADAAAASAAAGSGSELELEERKH